jgi:hypothetical protein
MIAFQTGAAEARPAEKVGVVWQVEMHFDTGGRDGGFERALLALWNGPMEAMEAMECGGA